MNTFKTESIEEFLARGGKINKIPPKGTRIKKEKKEELTEEMLATIPAELLIKLEAGGFNNNI